jgi:hypothetical protein
MKGLSTRTTKLGFEVLRLHYSADEAKNPETPEGKKWYEEARRGMSEARFRQEYEIDYGALGGQLVFPEFDESIHVVENTLPLDAYHSTVWLGADPHPRTAHAFLWLAVNKWGGMSVAWSYWPDDLNKEREQNGAGRLTVKDYVDSLKLVDDGGLGLKPSFRVMDVAGKSFNVDEERSYFDAYRDAGVYFRPAKRNRDLSGYDLIAAALRPTPHTIGSEEVMRPKLTIMAGMGDNDELVRQLKNLRFREWKGLIEDKNPPQEPAEKDRHLVDCLSYVLLEKPFWSDPTPMRSTYKPIYPAIGS